MEVRIFAFYCKGLTPLKSRSYSRVIVKVKVSLLNWLLQEKAFWRYIIESNEPPASPSTLQIFEGITYCWVFWWYYIWWPLKRLGYAAFKKHSWFDVLFDKFWLNFGSRQRRPWCKLSGHGYLNVFFGSRQKCDVTWTSLLLSYDTCVSGWDT